MIFYDPISKAIYIYICIYIYIYVFTFRQNKDMPPQYCGIAHTPALSHDSSASLR